MRNSYPMTRSARLLALAIFCLVAVPGCTDADPGTEVAFQVQDKYTVVDDGPGAVVLAGIVQTGVLRPGDGLEILGGGSDTGMTIREIRVGAPAVVVDSLAAEEYGNIVVNGELSDFEFDSQLVRPTE